MVFTQPQRFVYSLIALIFATILLLVAVNVYSIEIFIILLIIEFLIVVELTKPLHVKASWRRNIAIVVLCCIAIFAVIVGQHVIEVLS